VLTFHEVAGPERGFEIVVEEIKECPFGGIRRGFLTGCAACASSYRWVGILVDAEFSRLFYKQRSTNGNVWKTAMIIQTEGIKQAAKLRANTQSVTRTSDAAIQGERNKMPYTEPSDMRTGQAKTGEAKPTYVPAPAAANKVAPAAPPDMSTGQAKTGTAKPTDPSKPPILSADKGTGQARNAKPTLPSKPPVQSADKGTGQAGNVKPTDPSKPPIQSADKGPVQKGDTKPVGIPAPVIPSANKGPGPAGMAQQNTKPTHLQDMFNKGDDEETRFDAWE